MKYHFLCCGMLLYTCFKCKEKMKIEKEQKFGVIWSAFWYYLWTRRRFWQQNKREKARILCRVLWALHFAWGIWEFKSFRLYINVFPIIFVGRFLRSSILNLVVRVRARVFASLLSYNVEKKMNFCIIKLAKNFTKNAPLYAYMNMNLTPFTFKGSQNYS